MKIPTKFHLNLEDYKIYFDNEKKTYVCEDLETGEKTNIGVIGTFLQMGILKILDNNPTNPDNRISYLMDKVVSLEQRLGQAVQEPQVEQSTKPKRVEVKELQPEPKLLKPKREPILKKYPKSKEEEPAINQRIMEKILEKTLEEEEEDKKEKLPRDVNIESNEEIDNWMEI